MVVLPRDESDSKYLVMQKLRDMNSQLEAIDHMSRNMEREFKGTRLVSSGHVKIVVLAPLMCKVEFGLWTYANSVDPDQHSDLSFTVLFNVILFRRLA